jgi:signal transduction histidine kinase/ligand-binding sensor domain-containing protein
MFPIPRHFPLLLVALAALSLGARGSARAEEFSPEAMRISDEYTVKTWLMEDGLPGNTVSGIAQTSDGYLWLGGRPLARFDGVRFAPFYKDSTPGLESNMVSAVLVDHRGDLWVGLEHGGVARRKAGRFETVVPSSAIGMRRTFVDSLVEDKEGAIWFACLEARKVYRWRNGSLSEFSNRDGISGAINLVADFQGNIWAFNWSSCSVFDGKRFKTIDSKLNGWPTLAAARAGGVWASMGGHLFRYQKDGSIQEIADLGKLEVRKLYEDRFGGLWVFTSNYGLFLMREGRLLRLPGSPTAYAYFCEDSLGNLWVGTTGGGLQRVRHSQFFLHTVSDGLLSDYVVSICEDSEARLWLAQRGGSFPVVRAIDSSNKQFAQPEGELPSQVMAMTADGAGNVWLAALNGLNRWHKGQFSLDAPIRSTTSVLVDRNGDQWVAQIEGGLGRFRNGKTELVPQDSGLAQPRALAEDRRGRLWVGTEEGRVFFRDSARLGSAELNAGQFVQIALPDSVLGNQIRFIVPDENQTLWIGVADKGLYRWRNGKGTLLPNDAGMPLNDPCLMEIEPGGDFWVAASSNLFRVARGEIDEVLDHHKKLLRAIHFGRDDGMPAGNFGFGFKNSVTRTNDGHLWFATTRGALEMRPEPPAAGGPAFPVQIDEVSVGGELVATSGSLLLPPKPAAMQIQYTQPELGAPDRVRFRYRLRGLEEDWMEAGTGRTATYAHLPPGDYRFEVAATKENGPWSTPASFSFRVRPAFWETVWFKFGLGLIGAGAMAGGGRWVVKRRMLARLRALEQEHALERERIRLARDLHDQVGANLTQIALMASFPGTEETRTRLAQSAREAVDALDAAVWAVNPGMDTLGSLLQYLTRYAEDYLKDSALRLRINIPTEVPERKLSPEFRHHVLLVVKEALNNALKYSGASEISLGAQWDEARFAVEIADNGKGFDPGASEGFGNGLENMRQRAREIGGGCRIQSGEGRGTTIALEAPWPNGSRQN